MDLVILVHLVNIVILVILLNLPILLNLVLLENLSFLVSLVILLILVLKIHKNQSECLYSWKSGDSDFDESDDSVELGASGESSVF